MPIRQNLASSVLPACRELSKVVLRHLKENPIELNSIVSDVVGYALKEKFPCNAGN